MTKPARSRAKPKLPNGYRAVMASRREKKDSRDLFPTPPWATRALCEVVLPHLHRPTWQLRRRDVWEPACGEGHMAGVLREYFNNVVASDLHGDGCPQIDFFKHVAWMNSWDWVITNPPYGDKMLRFMLRALDLARKGVAMFVPSRCYCEGITRYTELFSDRPPTLFAPFVERVPIYRERWVPDGGTATAYCWLVWLKDAQGRLEPPRPTFWIPPGQRKALSRPDDRARFAAPSLPQQEAAE